ncbi:DUF4838 domain-containing protein [Paenibacillus nasutitermitis]|uniref:Alpha glucuronidase N-terminal domain-containing protein n=1 Tax=Paenibacillus nasutitermitis TaxID=1652958 RepID=A0A916ZDD9_9BACL|nr:DUF4838 domain-containing protein [Paenibacillus nasutitermitis]GGD89807.1 hypothetical protein GCM10010911_55580 [Paenibacillus nasutitermitis]
MDIVSNGNAAVSLVVEQEETALFAAAELQKYIFKMTGSKLPIKAERGEEPTIWIGCVPWCEEKNAVDLHGDQLRYDGFAHRFLGRDLVLTGNLPRGVLYAVYALLEQFGCRWFCAGEAGENIPSVQHIVMETRDIIENPDFEFRTFTEDTRKKPAVLWKNEMIETIEWCGKNRINSLHVHEAPATVLDEEVYVIEELKRRGMRYEFGGHGVEHFVDRGLFDQKPHLFRESGGQRLPTGNVCGASDEAVAMLTSGVQELIANNPQVDLYHLWFADVNGGSWCDCPQCKDIHPSTQQLSVINRIAAGVREWKPSMSIDMLLYHDTMDVNNIAVEPGINVCGFFAPRERCYAHSLSDESCELNRHYNRMLRETKRKFGENTYVFDYYADMILFNKMKFSIPKVIVEDLRHYKSMGITKSAALMFGQYSWWAYSTNLYVYAKAAWNTAYEVEDSLTAFYEHCYLGLHALMPDYHARIKQASYGMLTFCGYTGLEDGLRNIPPQWQSFQLKHIRQIEESVDIYASCLAILEEAVGIASEREKQWLADEILLLRISQFEAESIYYQMLGRYAYVLEENKDPALYENYMNRAIARKQEQKPLLRSLSAGIGGTSEDDIFLSHLCDDQIHFINDLKKITNA